MFIYTVTVYYISNFCEEYVGNHFDANKETLLIEVTHDEQRNVASSRRSTVVMLAQVSKYTVVRTLIEKEKK